VVETLTLARWCRTGADLLLPGETLSWVGRHRAEPSHPPTANKRSLPNADLCHAPVLAASEEAFDAEPVGLSREFRGEQEPAGAGTRRSQGTSSVNHGLVRADDRPRREADSRRQYPAVEAKSP
jgi:hypothetical protein